MTNNKGGTRDVSVRFPVSFLENELLEAYPAASKVSDAIRMATQNDVERRKDTVTPDAITNSVVKAFEEYELCD